MTKTDVEKLLAENKLLKVELQKLKSKSDFYTDPELFSNPDNNLTSVEDINKVTPKQGKYKHNSSIDFNSLKAYDLSK